MKLYPWLETPYRRILASYQRGKGHHALLLHSHKGNGEASLIEAISQWLMCYEPNGMKNCENCYSCQLMKAGNHPDYYKLEREEGKKSLGVERIRAVINILYSRSHQDGMKVVWIASCEQLTEEAVHALLKILEEPPSDTYFLLGCQEPSRLFSTLFSRCLYWFLPPPKEEIGLYWLKNIVKINDLLSLTAALRLSGHSPLAALDLLHPSRWKERIALCASIGNAMAKNDFLILLPIMMKMDQDDDAPLYWIISLLIDSLKWQQKANNSIMNVDNIKLIMGLAVYHPTMVLHHQIQQWMTCFRQWNTIIGINTELLLTHRLLDWEQTTRRAFSSFI